MAGAILPFLVPVIQKPKSWEGTQRLIAEAMFIGLYIDKCRMSLPFLARS
jgi:hypothetical protein